MQTEFVKSFEIIMKGFFRHLPEKNLYYETIFEVMGGKTKDQEDSNNKCEEIDDQMKLGIEMLALTYLHNNMAYSKENKHRPQISSQEMENFLFVCGKLSNSNNRWYPPILLRTVEQEAQFGGGDGCRFNNWSTGNYRGNNQFKPRGFI